MSGNTDSRGCGSNDDDITPRVGTAALHAGSGAMPDHAAQLYLRQSQHAHLPQQQHLQSSPQQKGSEQSHSGGSGGAAGGIGGGASPSAQLLGVDSTTFAKRSKEQEKNRRAQARFRERQKMKHGETERRMQDLETAVQQLQVERDALAIKADALERCLLQGEPGPNGEGSPQDGQSDAAFREYVEWYKARVQQLAPLLVQAQFDVSSEAGKKITTIWAALVKEGIKFYRDESIRTRVYSAPILHEDEAQPPRPDKALWRQVTAALQMTAAQRQRCQTVRNSYLSSMSAIMTERQALNAQMQDMPDCDANAKVALHTAKALDALEKLQANLKQEQVLQSELSMEVFEQLLTPIQAATALVGLYPWAPDKLAILDCACSEPP